MAVFDATPVASASAPVNIALNTVTVSAEQAPGQNSLITLCADQTLTITFGAAGNVTAPSAVVGLRIPANTFFRFDTGIQAPSFKVFNTSGSTAAVSYQAFSKF
jgi:hypothetical protein